MTTHLDRIVLVFPIAEINRPAAASMQTLEIVNGRQFENIVPLDPALVSEYATDFNLPLVAQVEALTAEREELIRQVAEIEAKDARIAELEAELDTLKNPVNPFPDADWQSFRAGVLSHPAVNRVAAGNQTSWPLMVLYLSQLQDNPARGLDIAQLWTHMESITPVTEEEVAELNAIATDCNVPLRMNLDGSIGQ